MRVRATGLSAALLILVLPSTSRAQEAREKRFTPEKHFPAPAVVYASVANVARLRQRLSETLLGRIATHPGTRRAFQGLYAMAHEKLSAEWQPFVEVAGKTPLEVLELLHGEVAFCLKGIVGAGGMPEAAIAIELGEKREEILGVLGRLRKAAEEAEGKTFESEEIEGIRAVAWPLPGSSVLEAVLGGHLVVATSPQLMGAIAKAWQEPPAEGAVRGFLEPEAAKQLAVNDREVVFSVNLEVVRALASVALAQAGNAGDVQKVLEVSGLDRLTSLGYALGFRDGGMEGALHLGMREGAGGALEIIRSGMPPLGDPGEALALIPASAHEVQAGRVLPGKILRELDRLVRESFPEITGEIDDAYDTLERTTGISLEKDVFPLTELTLYGYRTTPPAGGLFPDDVLLVRTETLGGYWKLLRKIASSLGASFETVEGPGGKVEYVNLLAVVARENLSRRFFGSQRGGTPDPSEAILMMLAFGGIVVARTDLPDGWSALSTLPQALLRHLEHYARAPKMADDAVMAALAKQRLAGAAGASISRGGAGLLAVYNSLLTLASAFSSLATAAGIDLARMPPAEWFLDAVRPGYLRLELGPAGFTARGHRATESTSAAALAAVGGASVMAGFLVPTLMRGRGEAYKVQCANNLKQLFGLSLAYSTQAGGNAHLHSPDGSIAALQKLIDAEELLLPGLFLCPEGEEHAAEVVDGKVRLTADTCSYEIVPWRLKNTTANAILLYDRRPHHHGGRNVIMTDGAVTFMGEAEFQEQLARDRERFSRPAEPAEPTKPAKPAKKAKKAVRKAPLEEEPPKKGE